MDGGKGQVNIALSVLNKLNLQIPVCGMVKDDNHRTRGLYYNNEEIPIDRSSEGFKLITRIQDEAHRFAIEFHRKLRSQGQVHSVLDVMQLLIFAFGAVMLIISFVLLGNTVRLAVFSHHEAIKTMKLVGATKWFIIRPFLGRSLLQGLLAGVFATLLFIGVIFGLQYSLPGFEVATHLKMAIAVAAAMVVLGVALSTLFTFVAVNKCVNMRSNKIYLY